MTISVTHRLHSTLRSHDVHNPLTTQHHFACSILPLRPNALALCMLLCMLCIASTTNAGAAGWDLENQRPTNGRNTVAGVIANGDEDTDADEHPETSNSRHEDESDAGEPHEEESLEQGEWSLSFGLDGQLFPSAIIALSTLNPENIGVQQPEHSFGSPLGMASLFIRAAQPGDTVSVEITSTKLISPSKMTVVLPDADTVYEISPHLKYEYEKLLAIRQPYPEDMTAKVYVNGEEVGERTQTVIVRSINDCFYGLIYNDGQDFQDWSEMFAAYVNEGDPIIDDILSEALRKGYVDAFIGYQGDENDVQMQVAAIWNVLHERGVKYSSITTTSVESQSIAAQHVRLVGDSTRGAQANCVDGSVLLASVFRKIGLDAYLVLLPGHMMVAVSMHDAPDAPVMSIETTMLSGASLDQAHESAQSTLSKYGEGSSEITYISVNGARNAGILPLRNLFKQ